MMYSWLVGMGDDLMVKMHSCLVEDLSLDSSIQVKQFTTAQNSSSTDATPSADKDVNSIKPDSSEFNTQNLCKGRGEN